MLVASGDRAPLEHSLAPVITTEPPRAVVNVFGDKIWQKETAVVVLTRIPLEIIQSVNIVSFFSLFWFYSVGVYHKFIKLAREECP